MYKVFINDKPLYLTSGKDSVQFSETNTLKLKFNSEKDILKAMELLSASSTASGVIIYSENENNLWDHFCSLFKIIEAAGGIVLNKKKEILMIYRNEKWDLPKGKIEKNEKPNEAALREVCEETGVCDCEIIKELPATYHTYLHKKENVLKTTFWYKMNCKSFSEFRLQEEEGIIEAKWIDKTMLKGILKYTYPSLTELIKSCL